MDAEHYSIFESQTIELISSYLNELNFIPTKKTRDGNKDAISTLISARTEEMQSIWLEIKYRKNANRSIGSRDFDSTLVSATEDETIVALYFATNSQVNKKTIFRIKEFCERAIPNLNGMRVFDGDSLRAIEKNRFHELLSLDDLIIEDCLISNCIDFSNFNLSDEKILYPDCIYYLIIPAFLPHSSKDIELSADVFLDEIHVKRYKFSSGWNFISFRHKFRSNDVFFRVTLRNKKGERIVDKYIRLIESKKSKIIYSSQLQLLSSISESRQRIVNRTLRKSCVLIEGDAASGKTYAMEEICAEWSASHEIMTLQISGEEYADKHSIYRIALFGLNSLIGMEEAIDDINSSITQVTTALMESAGSRRHKLLLVDDVHKLPDHLVHDFVDAINLIVAKNEHLSIFMFSRPNKIETSIQFKIRNLETKKISGLSEKDISNTLELNLERSPTIDEVSIVHDTCPNLVTLLQLVNYVFYVDKNLEIPDVIKKRKSEILLPPDLDQVDSELLYLIYSFSAGISFDELKSLGYGEENLISLIRNGMIRERRVPDLKVFPSHDLWRPAIDKKFGSSSAIVLDKLKATLKSNKGHSYPYLSILVRSDKLCSKQDLSVARIERDKFIGKTDFYNARVLAESIVQSPFHSLGVIDRASDIDFIYEYIKDYVSVGDILNHCSYNQAAREYLESALHICKKFLHIEKICDLYVWVKSEIYNLDYWAFNLDYLKEKENFYFNLKKPSGLRLRSISALKNREMMALYLLDRNIEAKSKKNEASRFCLKHNLVNEKIHLSMDSAKNEIFVNPSNALRLYTYAINEYIKYGKEDRRKQVALAQRESLRVKLGKGSIEHLIGYSCGLEKKGYSQEYMNSQIDLATIYAMLGQCDKAEASLRTVSSHPDFRGRNRQRYKVNQCLALIAIKHKKIDECRDLLIGCLKQVKNIGRSYSLHIEHNLKELELSNEFQESWCFSSLDLKSGALYFDPRLW